MKQKLLLVAIALTPCSVIAADIFERGYRAYESPVNHHYLGVQLGGGNLNEETGSTSELSVSNLSLQMLANEDLLVNFEYEARFINAIDTSDRADNYSGMLGYRLPMTTKSDVILGVRLGGSNVTRRDNQKNEVLYKDRSFMKGISAGYYYGFTDCIDSRIIFGYMDSSINSEKTVEAGLDYYLGTHLSVGAYGKLIVTENNDLSHFGIMAKLRL